MQFIEQFNQYKSYNVNYQQINNMSTANNNKEQLLQQMVRCVQQNDIKTLKILMQDEQQSKIQQLRSKIKYQNIQRFNQFMQKWQKQKQIKLQDGKTQDKIRKINANYNKQQSQNQENLIQKQLKKKKQWKLEQQFGYAFYGNVKCLMIAYGDLKPKQQTIKTMHSQIQILFQIIVKFIITTESGKKINETVVKQNIQMIFKQQTKIFQQISKQYKKVTKNTKKQQYSQSSSDQDSFPQQQKRTKHMQFNSIEQSQYFASLTKSMDEKQYQNYSDCRSVNFLQSSSSSKTSQETIKKFIAFIDSQKKILTPQMRIFQLLSFVCCRLVRKIIFKIIRQNNNDKLQPIFAFSGRRITIQQLKNCGNKLIQQFEEFLTVLRQQKRSQLDKAYELFYNDLNDIQFRQLLPRKYSKSPQNSKTSTVQNKNDAKIAQIWKDSPHYQQMWLQRYKGQKQIEIKTKQSLQQNKKVENINDQIMNVENDANHDIQVKNQYAKFILKNWNYYAKYGSAALWKKYFSQEKISIQTNEGKDIQKTTKKRAKLQSLNS